MTKSPDCLTLQIYQTNQMFNGEPSQLLVAKGYWKSIRAKLLHVVDDIFCSIPIDNANCCYLDHLIYGASTVECKPVKNGV